MQSELLRQSVSHKRMVFLAVERKRKTVDMNEFLRIFNYIENEIGEIFSSPCYNNQRKK